MRVGDTRVTCISNIWQYYPIVYFQDLHKYMKGELKEDVAYSVIRSIVSYGIKRVELRDEIYCQLVRQCTSNSHKDYLQRLWVLWSLRINQSKYRMIYR